MAGRIYSMSHRKAKKDGFSINLEQESVRKASTWATMKVSNKKNDIWWKDGPQDQVHHNARDRVPSEWWWQPFRQMLPQIPSVPKQRLSFVERQRPTSVSRGGLRHISQRDSNALALRYSSKAETREESSTSDNGPTESVVRAQHTLVTAQPTLVIVYLAYLWPI